ncbi:MAG: right-handed parallel beta-helix repeat-containing protein [Candidatus Brocadiia bacterium]
MKQAFALIELLVLIAFAAFVVGMLMPANHRAALDSAHGLRNDRASDLTVQSDFLTQAERRTRKMATDGPTDEKASDVQLFVSTRGDDGWPGRLPEPNAEGTDGPLRSLEGARRAVRRLREEAALEGPVTVRLRGGRYVLDEPVTFRPEDSAPVTYESYPGEEAILDGGRRITGWRIDEVNGRTCWVTELPEVAEGEWYFRQLFVNGERRRRARLPKEGTYVMEDVPGREPDARWGSGHDRQFRAAEGEFGSFHNLSDVEVVALHFWLEERSPVADYDEDTRMVTLERPTRGPLSEDRAGHFASYYIDNVFEGLTEPGEWYLDRASGQLYYVPMPGEAPETSEVFAPRLLQFLRLLGDAREGRHMEFLRFRNLTFEHSRWTHPGAEDDDAVTCFRGRRAEGRWVGRVHRGGRACGGQAASDVPGAIYVEGARNCVFEACRVRHVGWYGMELVDGCRGNRFVGNEIADMGGGGIKLNGGAERGPLQTSHQRITDNHIHAGGRVFHCAVGILLMSASSNDLSHNHIHDFYYTGISCGWTWGYDRNSVFDNRIEHNHIHNLGQGVLSDIGGIYTLGVQPGTVIRGNLIHDVVARNYGGWGIYPDEGTSHVIIENNICHDFSHEPFSQHFGRENIVRNNIFALGKDGTVGHGRADEGHSAFNLRQNILVTDGASMFRGGYGVRMTQRNHWSDLNLMWDVSGEPLSFRDRHETVDLEGWRALRHDRHSLVADPGFRDVEARDFRLSEGSPALQLGFEPIDMSNVGPRPPEERG